MTKIGTYNADINYIQTHIWNDMEVDEMTSPKVKGRVSRNDLKIGIVGLLQITQILKVSNRTDLASVINMPRHSSLQNPRVKVGFCYSSLFDSIIQLRAVQIFA